MRDAVERFIFALKKYLRIFHFFSFFFLGFTKHSMLKSHKKLWIVLLKDHGIIFFFSFFLQPVYTIGINFRKHLLLDLLFVDLKIQLAVNFCYKNNSERVLLQFEVFVTITGLKMKGCFELRELYKYRIENSKINSITRRRIQG